MNLLFLFKQYWECSLLKKRSQQNGTPTTANYIKLVNHVTQICILLTLFPPIQILPLLSLRLLEEGSCRAQRRAAISNKKLVNLNSSTTKSDVLMEDVACEPHKGDGDSEIFDGNLKELHPKLQVLFTHCAYPFLHHLVGRVYFQQAR